MNGLYYITIYEYCTFVVKLYFIFCRQIFLVIIMLSALIGRDIGVVLPLKK